MLHNLALLEYYGSGRGALFQQIVKVNFISFRKYQLRNVVSY